MKFRFSLQSALILLTAIFATASHLNAQAAQPVDAKVCDVLKNPTQFDGKLVRIQGTVVAGLEEFIIKGAPCGLRVNALWLSYPRGTEAVSGPVIMLELQPARNFAGTAPNIERMPIKLSKDKSWRQFDNLLGEPYKGRGVCLGCARNTVNATLIGRIDAVRNSTLTYNSAGKITALGGFGNLNGYPVRMLLQSVSDVVAQPVDYSKITDAVRSDSEPATDAGDPRGSLAAAAAAAQSYGTSPNGKLIQRAVDAYGQKDDDNGVEIAFGITNEVDKSESASRHDSPDGVIYNCTFDPTRLKGVALSYAMVHIGSHIADIRAPQPASGPIQLFVYETNAWFADAFYAIGKNQNNIVLPGGYLLWSKGWPIPERSKNMDTGLLNFLVTQEMLHP